MGLGEKIINLRKSHNLTQEELAKRLFVTRQAISKYERGVCFPSIDTMKLISKEFNISINDLLEVNKENKSIKYKPLGFKQQGFIGLYVFYFFLISYFAVIFNINYKNTELILLVLYDILFIYFFFMILNMLIKTIFPLNKILIEYNDYNLKIKTLRKIYEIKFEDIESIEIKPLGKLNSGRLIIYTKKDRYEVYPLKNLNEIKTIIDQIML